MVTHILKYKSTKSKTFNLILISKLYTIMVFMKTKFDLNIFDKFDEKFALKKLSQYLA
jgi:hypothetical protein